MLHTVAGMRGWEVNKKPKVLEHFRRNAGSPIKSKSFEDRLIC
jgi:hypothetical protein